MGASLLKGMRARKNLWFRGTAVGTKEGASLKGALEEEKQFRFKSAYLK